MSIRFIPALLCVLALVASGCGKPDDDFQTVSEADAKKAEANSKSLAAAHAHEAPHGGELIEIGDHQYNVELVLADDHSLTAYVLGGHAEKAVSIEQKTLTFHIEDDEGEEVGIKLVADPQEGDEDGKSSRFVAKGDAVPAILKTLEGTHGHVHINIGGDEFLGDLKHHDEDGEHKDHDDEKGHKDHDDHKDGEHKDGDKDSDKEHKDGDQDSDKK